MTLEKLLLSPISWLRNPVFCLPDPVYCLLSPISCLTSPAPRLLSHVSYLMPHISHILFNVSFPMSPISRLLSHHIFCLTSPVSCSLSPVSHLHAVSDADLNDNGLTDLAILWGIHLYLYEGSRWIIWAQPVTIIGSGPPLIWMEIIWSSLQKYFLVFYERFT